MDFYLPNKATVRSNLGKGTAMASASLLSGGDFEWSLLLSHQSKKDLALENCVRMAMELMSMEFMSSKDLLLAVDELACVKVGASLAKEKLDSEIYIRGDKFRDKLGLGDQWLKNNKDVIREI